MILHGRGPWWTSTAIHLAALAAVGIVLFQTPAEPPSVLRMRLVSLGGDPPHSSTAPVSAWTPPSAGRSSPEEPNVPGWQEVGSSPAVRPLGVQVPVSLGDILGSGGDPAPEAPSQTLAPTSGWSGPGGVGYTPPPLPPPRLSPPQGAHWTLVLSVPSGGGFARSFEGLDSGHPELDTWLEEYLRTVSFPSSPDGQDYTVRWNLRLEAGKPQ